MHGGARRLVGLCITCHNDASSDAQTGNTVNLPVLIHRIHMGVDLPSVVNGPPGTQYAIAGYRDVLHVWSEKLPDGTVTGVRFPRDQRQCSTCHAGAAQEDLTKTEITEFVCTTCHDTISFVDPPPAGKVLHPAGAEAPDSCSLCHAAGALFDFQDRHLTDEAWLKKNGQLPGLDLAIVDVTNVAPDTAPTITFTVQDDAGNAILVSDLARIVANIGGPNADIAWSVSEDLSGATQNPDGSWTVTGANPLPTTLAGGESVTVGLEGYQMIPFTRYGTAGSFRETAMNPVAYFAVGGGTPTPREEIVDQAKCEKCHYKLELHGTIRKNTKYCVVCHNMNATDASQRPASAGTPQSIYFPVLIHKIHAGENLQNGLTVYGYGGSKHDFSDVRFPGQLGACTTCHIGTTYEVPEATPCLTCHDSAATAAHAALNTTASGVESCEVCHGAGQAFGVDVVHTHTP